MYLLFKMVVFPCYVSLPNRHFVRSSDGLCLGGGDYDPLPSHFSLELKSLVARLLAVDPEQRLNLAEALKEEARFGKPESETGETEKTQETHITWALDFEWIFGKVLGMLIFFFMIFLLARLSRIP